MPSIDILLGDYQFFNDNYTNIAEAALVQHCETYFALCRKMKTEQTESEKHTTDKHILEEMEYFVHGQFERDISIMCNGSVPITGSQLLFKLDELVADTETYPEDNITFTF